MNDIVFENMMSISNAQIIDIQLDIIKLKKGNMHTIVMNNISYDNRDIQKVFINEMMYIVLTSIQHLDVVGFGNFKYSFKADTKQVEIYRRYKNMIR